MINTIAVIIADGSGTRWNNYLGVPKHLIEIDNERLIDRTVRLLTERNINKIFVVGPDDRYKVKGSELFTPIQNPDNGDIDKFMNSAELWNDQGKTIVLYGDVYFTEEAMNSIVAYHEIDFALHCRPFNSQYTGTPYGECFALTFYHQHREEILDALTNIVSAFNQNVITRAGGWEVYKFFQLGRNNYPDDKLDSHWLTNLNLNAINDFTDDFDYPEDYDRFMERWNK